MRGYGDPILSIDTPMSIEDIVELGKINPAIYVVMKLVMNGSVSLEQGLLHLVRHLHAREHELMKMLVKMSERHFVKLEDIKLPGDPGYSDLANKK